MENEKAIIIVNKIEIKSEIINDDTGSDSEIDTGVNDPNPVIIEGTCRDGA